MGVRQSELRRTEEWLNERWEIVHMTDKDGKPYPANQIYYDGAIRAIEFLGYSWMRDEKGKHKLIKD